MSGSDERDRSTFKACRPCRKKRTRCDGQQPCQRCQLWSTECVYDQRPGETKSRLRDERAELQSHQKAATTVLEALASGQDCEATLESLWRNESVHQIARKLNRRKQHASTDEDVSPGAHLDGEEVDDEGTGGEEEKPENTQQDGQLEKGHFATPSSSDNNRHAKPAAPNDPNELQDKRAISKLQSRPESIVTSGYSEAHEASRRASLYSNLSSPSFFTQETAPNSACPINFDTASLQLGDSSAGSPSTGTWDGSGLQILPYELVQKLLAVFDHQYVPFPTIQRDLFIRDFHQGDRVYCSSALLRSISCLACRVLGGYDASASSYAALGDRLYAETNLLLASTNPIEYCIPDAQALGNLAMHQLGLGKYSDARNYADESVRRIDIACRRQDCEYQEMPKHTMTVLFGAISFARMVRLTVEYLSTSAPFDGKKPFTTNTVGNVPNKVDAHVEQLLASPGPAEANQLPEGCRYVPSFMAQLTGWVYSFTCRSQIADEGLPTQLCDTYRACLSWYQAVMDNIDNEDKGGPFVHLYYHFCLLALFRPYRYIPDTNAEISPKEICAESGAAVLALAQSCHDLGTQHLPCFVPLFVHAVGLLDIDDRALHKRSPTRSQSHDASSMEGVVLQEPSPFSDSIAPLASPLPSPGGDFLVERAIALLALMGNIYPCARASSVELQQLMGNRDELMMDGM